MSEQRILIIGAGSTSAESVKNHLDDMGFSSECEKSDINGLHRAESGEFGIVIACVTKDNDIFRNLAISEKAGEIIVVTDKKQKKHAIEVFGDRAWTYITEPVSAVELRSVINRVESFIRLNLKITDTSKKVAYLEVINDIAREALLSEESEKLLWFIVKDIHEKLGFFNVSIFEIDEKFERAVLRAFDGELRNEFEVGYSLGIGEGIVGLTALKRESQLSGDVKNNPNRIQGFPAEENIQSEIAVPIMFENRVLGVLHVESEERDAFSRDDVIVLEILADQISLTFEKMRLSRELRGTYELDSVINDTLPVSILILKSDLVVKYANSTYCEISFRNREDILNQSIETVIGEDITQSLNIIENLKRVLENGETINYTNVRHSSPNHADKALNFTFVRVRSGEDPLVMILIQDITESTKKTYQLSLLREISIAMQGVLELDKRIHLILTCVTAGFAIGFNRAFIFLVDEDSNELRGYMGVGPRSHEEAYRIWGELASRQYTLQEYLENIHKGIIERSGLQDLIEDMFFDLNTADNTLTETISSGRYLHVTNAWEHPKVDDNMKRFITDEFVSIPLIARNQIIGVLLADNAYSGRGITPESIEMLTMFASHAGIAIENSRILNDLENKVNELRVAYTELEKTHNMLVRNEKLAAIGEVSARIAHEIRNPLSTIGGFAKSIRKKYKDRERTIRNAGIIVDEVERLEKILTSILDFSKPGTPKKTMNNINKLIKETLIFMENSIFLKNIVVKLDLTEYCVEAELDAFQIKQVLINVLQNSVDAIDDGGSIEIKTTSDGEAATVEIHDSGSGIPEQYIDNIFEPFFTTHGNGTGLGLSISNRIIQNHQGRFEISSREKEGTSVRIILPLNTTDEA